MTTTTTIPGGIRTDTLALVQTDGVTVAGNGTPASPLRLSFASLDVMFNDTFPVTPDVVGKAVVVTTLSPLPPLLQFNVGPATAEANGGPVSQAAAAIGIVTEILAIEASEFTQPVGIQYFGRVRLPVAVWDAAHGSVGGLVPGPYYVSALGGGKITPVRPTAPGTFVAEIGVALDAQTLELATPVVPLVNV